MSLVFLFELVDHPLMHKTLTQGFSRFLRRRGAKWHFERRPTPGVPGVVATPQATVVISVMVALRTGIRFVQEGRAHRAAEGLRAMVSNTATVLRRQPGSTGEGAPQEIAQRASW